MKFTFQRDRVVATTKGHVVSFKKGVPTEVPAMIYDEVIAAGGVPDDEVPEAPAKLAARGPVATAERELELFIAFETIVARGKRDDFTAGGAPHVKAVEAELGWDVDSKERDTTWVKFKTKGD